MSNLQTIGDLKKAIADFQTLTGSDDNANVTVSVQSYTQRQPVDSFRISTIDGSYAYCQHNEQVGMSLRVWLGKGIVIVDKRKHGATLG